MNTGGYKDGARGENVKGLPWSVLDCLMNRIKNLLSIIRNRKSSCGLEGGGEEEEKASWCSLPWPRCFLFSSFFSSAGSTSRAGGRHPSNCRPTRRWRWSVRMRRRGRRFRGIAAFSSKAGWVVPTAHTHLHKEDQVF